jgi:hypothetical protein
MMFVYAVNDDTKVRDQTYCPGVSNGCQEVVRYVENGPRLEVYSPDF